LIELDELFGLEVRPGEANSEIYRCCVCRRREWTPLGRERSSGVLRSSSVEPR